MKSNKKSPNAKERRKKFQTPVSDEYREKLQDFIDNQDYLGGKWLWIMSICILIVCFLISVFTDYDGAFPRSGGLVICIGIYFIFKHLRWNKVSEDIYRLAIDLYTKIEENVHEKAYKSKTSNETPAEIAKLRVDRVYPHFVNAVISKLGRTEGSILIIGTIVNVYGDILVKFVRLYLGCVP